MPINDRLALAAGIGLVLPNRLLLQCGLRRRLDGWRVATGMVLRGEAATFVLSAFSIDIWSDAQPPPTLPDPQQARAHIAERLATFLSGEKEAHVHVRREPRSDRAQRCDGPAYTVRFERWLDGAARFVRPDCWTGDDCTRTCKDNAADVLLNIVCRVRPDGVTADLWLRANHIGIDGVPLQDIITRLQAAWGVVAAVTYPTPEEFAPHASPRACAGRPELAEIQAFIDFSPLLAWRQRENARLPEAMPIAAAILWRLARHPTFAPLRIGTTVEMPAMADLGRGVGVVVVQPAKYADRRDGLAHFVRDYNDQAKLTKRRRSGGCQTLDAAARLPARCEIALLRHALRGDAAFGSLGFTMIRDGKIFGAPLGDVGHPHGFIAIGSVALPTPDGRRVGCVTVKGPPQRIAG
ncbi:MAG TPA: hypothetical protein VLI90_15515, partial [Tepidisphaeraceae bacterium]|nr:hypothetical protein [Tepidisphaeraceae bacterium]